MRVAANSIVQVCLKIASPLVLFGLSACSLAPVSVRDTAQSLDRGEVQIDTGIYPNLTLSTAGGVTDKFDIGLDLEHSASLWSRYTFLEQDLEWSGAGCQLNHTETNRDIPTTVCVPVIGLAFNRR